MPPIVSFDVPPTQKTARTKFECVGGTKGLSPMTGHMRSGGDGTGKNENDDVVNGTLVSTLKL